MQADFHYCCIAVLARTAGYREDEALTIAYASQYVDDAVENKPVTVGEIMFDPVCTAYRGIASLSWGVQKSIYIPFHFLPQNPLKFPQISCLTRPGSPFAKAVITRALQEKDRGLRLYRLGIALHTFADTWAHQGFSGRSHPENDAGNLENKAGEPQGGVNRLISDFLPAIGHARLGHIPDQPWQTYHYRAHDGTLVNVNNPARYREAAKAVFEILRRSLPLYRRKSSRQWYKLSPRLDRLFQTPCATLEESVLLWQKEFQGLFKTLPFEYDRKAWRLQALIPVEKGAKHWDGSVNDDLYQTPFVLTRQFIDSDWVNFHRAAQLQRHFVLERLY